MESRTITILSFAVVGTLIDAETGIREWFRAHLRDHDRDIDQRIILTAFAEAEERVQREHPELSFTASLPRIYADIARAWELDTDETAALDFRDSIRDWPAFADAVSALRQLRDRYRLVAVTNADEWGMDAMSRTLGDPFEARITAEAVGANRTDARVWAHLLDTLGADAGEVLHCSASPRHDLASAHEFGLATAWLERPPVDDTDPERVTAIQPDVRVENLAELVEFLSTPRAEPPE